MTIATHRKSAVTLQLVQHKFYEGYDPTKEDDYSTQVEVDGTLCNLDIHDTPGEEDWMDHRTEYIRSGDGFMLVYSLQMLSSFEYLNSLREQILRVKDADDGHKRIPMVIIGNKCDLEEEYREVSTTQGRDLAHAFGCPFFETSAKYRINIEESWFELVRQIRHQDDVKRESSPPKKGAHRCLLS